MTKTWYAPNGLEIVGTLETMTGRAAVTSISDDGIPTHEGGTEVFFPSKTVERDGKFVFLDEDGEEWTFDQLTSERPEDDDEGDDEGDDEDGDEEPDEEDDE